jgi:hypothetical protein
MVPLYHAVAVLDPGCRNCICQREVCARTPWLGGGTDVVPSSTLRATNQYRATSHKSKDFQFRDILLAIVIAFDFVLGTGDSNVKGKLFE